MPGWLSLAERRTHREPFLTATQNATALLGHPKAAGSNPVPGTIKSNAYGSHIGSDYMVGKRILIAYGSRWGCTAEVALEVAKVLREEGLEPQMLDLGEVKPRAWPALGGFDGVLLGSGIKIGKWTKTTRRFLDVHRNDIGSEGRRLGVFVCCLEALKDPEEARRKYCEDAVARSGASADLCEAFPGVLDLSEGSRMGFLEKKITKAAGPDMVKDTGREIDVDERNDYRDWEAIRAFARRFAGLVQG